MVVFSVWPFLVVIKTTPFAAAEPYSAAAEGPVIILILAISSGFKSATASDPPISPNNPSPPLFPVLKIGTPSITYNALLSLVRDFIPRITTRVAPPAPVAPLLI